MKLHLFPYAGISGDMFLGLLVDLGLPVSALEAMLQDLHLSEVTFEEKKVLYHGIIGTKINVIVPPQDEERHLSDIEEILVHSALPISVQSRALQCFRFLAEAEAKVHGTTPEEIHFHEVGALDAIVDICGAMLGLHLLNITDVSSQEVSLGTGFVKCDHGTMPVPVPAVCELMKGIPTKNTTIPYELTTPTGAAILKTICSRFLPDETQIFQQIGYGAGSREMEEAPNLLRGCLCQETSSSERVTLLETNLDDCSPQWLGYLSEKLFQEGALDVFMTPIYMKKNRLGTLLSCLCTAKTELSLEHIIFAETSTFGIRKQWLQRDILERSWVEVETEFGSARVKVGKGPEGLKTFTPEYEDCKKLAQNTQKPLKEIIDAVLQAYRRKF
ncbi:MAG: nickel pincer cofactor biosynthesis protein LarC [Planctomycetota bacterium]